MPPTPWPWPSPAGSSAELPTPCPPMSASDPSPPAGAASRSCAALARPASRAAAAGAAALAAAARRDLPPLVEPPRHLGLYWPLPGEPDLRSLAQLEGLRWPCPSPPAARAGRRGSTTAPGARASPWSPTAAASRRPAGPPLCPQRRWRSCWCRPWRWIGAASAWAQGGRLVRRLRARPDGGPCRLVVLAPGLLVEQLPADPWDVPFDGWLSEAGLAWRESVASL